jgi:CHAT domain-containing protein
MPHVETSEQQPDREPPGVQLAFRIFAPFEDMLSQDVKRLVVIPSGPLAQLAVETLPLDDTLLVLDQFEVSYLPSATFALLDRPTPPSTGHTLAVAVSSFPSSRESVLTYSSLPGARREVAQFATRGSCVLLDDQATRANVLPRFSDARYIHLATHGFSDPDDALRSFILLHPGDHLTAGDLMRCELSAELVVLSACRTGLSPGSPSEGVLGLPRALLLAGARGLIVSLWAVDDEATAALFNAFYALLWTGVPVAEALWRAKQELRASVVNGRRFTAPGYWGAFVYIGAPAVTA